MKRILLLALVAGLCCAAPASAGTSDLLHVPETFEDDLDTVREQSGLDVYLPTRIRVYFPARRIHGNTDARDGSYYLQLGIGRNCNGANVCFIAAFSAIRGERPVYRTRVRLRGGRTGRFKPLTCGASCSAPAIQWVEDGVLYDIQYKGASKRAEKRTLVKLANNAIAKGAR